MNNKRIIIDYLSLTFPLDLSGDENERVKAITLVDIFKDFFKLDECQIEECKYSVNNYRYQYIFSNYIYLRIAGPQNDFGEKTCQLELRGEGCREFERLLPNITWYQFIMFLLNFSPTFKRIDVTIDDLSGEEMKLDYLFNKIKNGYYTSVFKSEPKYYGMLDQGLTINLGSRKSMIELCIYDKLFQQKSLGKPVDYNYWTRYEMRFRQDKANSVILSLLDNYKKEDDPVYGLDLKTFATKALYRILDIKVDNNSDRGHQSENDTDPNWTTFLETTEKGILPKADARISTSETRYNYIMPKAKMIFLEWLIDVDFNLDVFIERFFNQLLELLKNTSRSQLTRLNQILLEKKKDTITQSKFDGMLIKLATLIDERSLPF
ncbi:MAG: replication initiation factor domain-containing protein [Acholeplasmatales bacterium]|nr:replication initiation factor domain-containing protein [Acholeplasmatales bacterium]